MGYYSDLRITLTKNDYLAMLKKDEKNKNICNFILDEYESYIYEYKKNNIDCVCIRSDSLKYYKEFSVNVNKEMYKILNLVMYNFVHY